MTVPPIESTKLLLPKEPEIVLQPPPSRKNLGVQTPLILQKEQQTATRTSAGPKEHFCIRCEQWFSTIFNSKCHFFCHTFYQKKFEILKPLIICKERIDGLEVSSQSGEEMKKIFLDVSDELIKLSENCLKSIKKLKLESNIAKLEALDAKAKASLDRIDKEIADLGPIDEGSYHSMQHDYYLRLSDEYAFQLTYLKMSLAVLGEIGDAP